MHFTSFFLKIKELQYRVLDQELNKWKREQQLSGKFLAAGFLENVIIIMMLPIIICKLMYAFKNY